MGITLPNRTFTTGHAEPGPRPLWIGLFSPSGGGKTFSALRLAAGIKSVIAGRINLIDTESGRGLHYADTFDYDYTPFPPPHGSLDYLAAITHAVKNGARIVVIDQMSSEHDGEGGMLEYQEAEMHRLGGDDWQKQERVKMLAWTKPKAARKALLRGMLAFGREVVFIICFRADEQSKPVKIDDPEKPGHKKNSVVNMGFMPIAGKPFVYEATVCALLMPGASGVPTWEPENVGERMMKKLPEQFKDLFEKTKGQPLSEAHGRAMAEWAKGGPARKATDTTERVQAVLDAFRAANSIAGVQTVEKKAKPLMADLEAAQDSASIDRIEGAKVARLEELQA